MSRLTERHAAVAVIRDKKKIGDAMEKLAKIENMSVNFAEFEAAENHIERNLFGDYERYIIFEKLT